MEEYKYKVEFDYSIEKHINIVSKMNKGTKTFSLIALIGSVLFWLGNVIKGMFFNGSEVGFVLLSVVLILIFLVLLSSTSKKTTRNRLYKVYGNQQIKFVYEFYDDYILVTRTGGDYESTTKIKYSALIKVDAVNENLAYISTKEQTVIFLTGSQIDEIINFVKTKINN